MQAEASELQAAVAAEEGEVASLRAQVRTCCRLPPCRHILAGPLGVPPPPLRCCEQPLERAGGLQSGSST